MKKIFKFAAILTIAAFTLSTVASCSKDDSKDEDEPQKEDPKPEDPEDPEENPYADWDGDWAVIGAFNDWSGDAEMTKSGDWYSAEVTLPDGKLEFKFRRDKNWGDFEFGIEGDTELGKELTLKPKAGNLKVAKAGVYKVELKPTAALGKVTFVKDIESD